MYVSSHDVALVILLDILLNVAEMIKWHAKIFVPPDRIAWIMGVVDNQAKVTKLS